MVISKELIKDSSSLPTSTYPVIEDNKQTKY